MSRRKISEQQRFRILKIQERRLQRAEMHAISEHQTQLGPEESGLLVTHHGVFADIEDSQGQLYRCHIRQHLGSLVAGDRVIFCKGKGLSGVIVALCPRKSALVRRDDNNQQKSVAANIDQVIVVLAPEPVPSLYLTDSYLVACYQLNLSPIILLNKVDLLNADEQRSFFQNILNLYGNIGYSVCTASTIKKNGIVQLESLLKDKTSVFVGQSGVGKSSLINALVPKAHLVVGELSEKNKLGSHTTTRSHLFHLSFGGYLIDSPGVRDFGFWPLEITQLTKSFPEFRPYLEQCKFRNCSHQHEPGCGILDAVQKHKISPSRFESFQKLRV